MPKLKRWLLFLVKKRRVRKQPIPKSLKKYPEKLVVRGQALVRGFLVRRDMRLLRPILLIRQRRLRDLEEKRRRVMYTSVRHLESNMLRRSSYAVVEGDQLGLYIYEEERKFATEWKDYEGQLEKYLMKVKEYKDWVFQKDDSGGGQWFNMKTLKQQKEHPGVKAFSTNKRVLREKAEEERMNQLKHIYSRREIIVESEIATREERTEEIKNLRLKLLF